jgi:hypothetical protein
MEKEQTRSAMTVKIQLEHVPDVGGVSVQYNYVSEEGQKILLPEIQRNSEFTLEVDFANAPSVTNVVLDEFRSVAVQALSPIRVIDYLQWKSVRFELSPGASRKTDAKLLQSTPGADSRLVFCRVRIELDGGNCVVQFDPPWIEYGP